MKLRKITLPLHFYTLMINHLIKTIYLIIAREIVDVTRARKSDSI